MSDLEKLKDLLFGREKEVLDSISERVERREMRSQDIADVLPEAIHTSHRKNSDLSEALRAPVGDVLRKEFREDPESYGDALYPVMGPAIRKSIMHALRAFAQQINETVEQSLTPRGLSWRLQAWRAGVPFGDYVMQKTLLYRVEQAYLISRENGLLVGHVQHEAAKIKDSDAVSAMFTAIQDFVKESFTPDRTGRLESADMGEFTLWAVHGPHALLVCVIRGVPPRSLRTDLSAILERIHFRYGEAIRDYAGDTSSIPEVEEELWPCLNLQAKQEEPEQADGKRRIPWMPIFLLTLVIAAAGYLIYTNITQQQRLDTLVAALDETPGFVVTEANATRKQLFITALRDPDAPTLDTVAASVGLDDAEIVSNLHPFNSLDPTLTARREAVALASERGLRVEALRQRLASLSGQNFYFIDGTTLTADSEIALAGFVARLDSLAADLDDFNLAVAATVIGHADAVGGTEVNSVIASERAESVARALRVLGWDGTLNTRAAVAAETTAAEVDLSQRRVTVELSSIDAIAAQ